MPQQAIAAAFASPEKIPAKKISGKKIPRKKSLEKISGKKIPRKKSRKKIRQKNA